MLGLTAFRVGTAISLVLVTIVLFNTDVRYKSSTLNILMNGDFREGLAGWETFGPTDGVSMIGQYVEIKARNAPKKTGIRQYIPISRGYEVLRIEANATALGLISRENRSIPALIRMVCQDENGKSLYDREVNFVSFMLADTNGKWRQHQEVLIVPSASRMCFFEAYIAKRAQGLLKILNLGVYLTSQRESWNIFFYALLGLWVFAISCLGVIVIRSIERTRWRLFWPLVACLLILSSVAPKPMKHKVGGWLFEKYSYFRAPVSELAPSLVEIFKITFSLHDPAKLAHIFLFALLACVTRLVWRKLTLIQLIFYLGVFAASAEVLQFFAQDRHPRVEDWYYDLFGILIGLTIIEFVKLLTRLVRFKH